MKDYNLAFIYKITNGELDYYGSSANTFENRKSVHMSTSNSCSSKKIIESGLPWTMEVVEYFPCSCVEELEDKEAWYIKNHPCVNERLPGAARRAGGRKEYKSQRYQDNKEEYNAKCKKRYQENAEEIKAKARVKHDCDVCGGKFTWSVKARHFKTKKHQRALAEAVAIHSPPPPPTVVTNNFTINCTESTINQ